MTTGLKVDFSVIVISKNEAMLDDTLDALEFEIARANSQGFACECIVVDASHGHLDWIRDRHPKVRWFQFASGGSKQITIPEQRNIGIIKANGGVIIFCDAGGAPTEGWLTNIATPILLGNAEATCGPVPSLNRDHYGVMNDLGDGAVVDSTATCNLALSSALIDRIGEFDESFEYGSDTDYCWRIADAGSQILNVRQASMTMDWGLPKIQYRRAWRYGKARARLFVKYPNRRATMVRTSSEYIAYGLWAIGMLTAISAVAIYPGSLTTSILFIVTATIIVPFFRNLFQRDVSRIVAVHILGGISFAFETIRLFVMGISEKRTKTWTN